jgi:NADH-quinone oxidoreductase E subunit
MARVLPPSAVEEIARLRDLYPHPQSALVPALHAAQESCGYLPEDALADVADLLGVPLSEVASVATFYSLFSTEPLGRHVIRVCTNLSCYLNGCEQVLDRLCARLGVRPGETTPDGRVTVEAVECLAACDEAPVALVDTERRPRLTPEAVDALVEELR